MNLGEATKELLAALAEREKFFPDDPDAVVRLSVPAVRALAAHFTEAED
jgi:hypothetical protein